MLYLVGLHTGPGYTYKVKERQTRMGRNKLSTVELLLYKQSRN